MKKSKSKSSLTKRESEGMNRNAPFMSTNTRRRYAAIVVAIIVKTIKGKLGFSINTADAIFLENSEAIAEALTLDEGGYFGTPFANLALLKTRNTALDTAIGNVNLGVLGAEGVKVTAKKNVKRTLDEALIYVNALALADQDHAESIITSAKMQVVKSGSINKQDFAVKVGPGGGEITLISLALKIEGKRVNASYEWQFSINNNQDWRPLPSTPVAKTVVPGLEIGVRYFFRKRVSSVKGGVSPWCAAIAATPE